MGSFDVCTGSEGQKNLAPGTQTFQFGGKPIPNHRLDV